VLRLLKVVVEAGNRADAARASDYRLEPNAAPAAFARADYQLHTEQTKRATGRSSSLYSSVRGCARAARDNGVASRSVASS
jgi:hypothetical protein